MREISLDRLRTLVAIADLGSFAEAARVLHLAPPTVSLHIADLESRVGGKLLSRTRGRIQPSAIGETLVERARRTAIRAQMGFGSAGATKGSTGLRTDTMRKYTTAQMDWAAYPPVLLDVAERFQAVLIERRRDGSDAWD